LTQWAADVDICRTAFNTTAMVHVYTLKSSKR